MTVETLIRESTVTWLDPFISQSQFLGPCDEAIKYAYDCDDWHSSEITSQSIINSEVRDSRHFALSTSSYPRRYVQNQPMPDSIKPMIDFVSSALDEYLSVNECANDFPSFYNREGFVIVHYAPGSAYWRIHSDYSPTSEVFALRHLGFIMYLNTIENGGETSFIRQDIKVKPVEGRTIIFPSGWTHAHSSLPAFDDDRYILQGWWSFESGYEDAPSQDTERRGFPTGGVAHLDPTLKDLLSQVEVE